MGLEISGKINNDDQLWTEVIGAIANWKQAKFKGTVSFCTRDVCAMIVTLCMEIIHVYYLQFIISYYVFLWVINKKKYVSHWRIMLIVQITLR